jgi:adenosine deaminase
MFETTLTGEYAHAQNMGLTPAEMIDLAEAGFAHSFLPDNEKKSMLDEFHSRVTALGLV